MKYDTVDQWLDWGDHTVTVDPIGNSAWIHEGQDGKHAHTVYRGRQYDAQDTRHLLGLLSKQETPATRMYVPSFADLAKVPRFPSRRSGGCDVWRGELRDVRGAGELPVIRAQWVDGRLPDVDKGTIERQMYNAEHARAATVLSRAGVPDHGRPSAGSLCR